MSTRKFPPLPADHWLVTESVSCAVCGIKFKAGDVTTLLPRPPTNPEDIEKANDGQAYTTEADPVHWDCVA